ncbi:hypothetical protein SPRG_09072 [Saprolegnia parasitica CBS 223.65]|uniref:Uncharacterized protein n=1 Tax=Saprolegnia parasitica (strain CBS 223.65) TaxID=695850 RepID=A0A067CGW5_SAPPC|nr:hypothetical protein SPRG_09072 [Saprolegnia parasitica CBS 223.65]KDO25776.1 hypothetical protein SPRG_09072 [Saprolegnia parasitica CBS 223.65]|eukprot:XP_012203580.1 hypothetical protein SPRG_09072 [Saprolegnia parasitica CBS 223.65]
MLFAHAKDKCAFLDAGAKPFATLWAETEADDALKARVYHQHATLRASLEQRDEEGKANPDDEEKAAPNEEASKAEMPSDAKRKRRDNPKVHVFILCTRSTKGATGTRSVLGKG